MKEHEFTTLLLDRKSESEQKEKFINSCIDFFIDKLQSHWLNDQIDRKLISVSGGITEPFEVAPYHTADIKTVTINFKVYGDKKIVFTPAPVPPIRIETNIPFVFTLTAGGAPIYFDEGKRSMVEIDDMFEVLTAETFYDILASLIRIRK